MRSLKTLRSIVQCAPLDFFSINLDQIKITAILLCISQIGLYKLQYTNVVLLGSGVNIIMC